MSFWSDKFLEQIGPRWLEVIIRGLQARARAWHFGYTISREITEVKQSAVRLVLGWVTAWCFHSCPSLAISVTSGDVQ